MDKIETGIGIRAAARAEMERHAKIRQDAAPVVEILRGLVAQLVEADIPASIEMLPMGYGAKALGGVLRIPPIHPIEDKGLPPWPETEPTLVAYDVTISTWGSYVELEGPYELAPDGSIERSDDFDDRHKRYLERFKYKGDAGYVPLQDLLKRVRELAIMREVALLSAAPAPGA